MANADTNVVVNYVTHPENADAVVTQIENNGGNATAIKADVSNETEVQSHFSIDVCKINRYFGK